MTMFPLSCELHVVLGAGPLGRATALALVMPGRHVRVVNRSGGLDLPLGIESVAVTLGQGDAAGAACAGAAAVYFCAQPPYHRWPQEFPALQEAAIAVASGSGARLVVAENLYGYGKVAGSMTETLPLTARTRKGRVRAEMHARLMDAHCRESVSVTVARGSDFFGPWVEGSAVGSRLFRAILNGRPAEVFGDPDTLHTYTFIEDFGAVLAILGTDDRAIGQVWHVPNAPAVSTRRFVELAFKLAKKKSRLRKVSRMELGALGLFVPPLREMKEMLYEFERPFVVDHRKFSVAFGDISTPLESAITQTLDWARGPSLGE